MLQTFVYLLLLQLQILPCLIDAFTTVSSPLTRAHNCVRLKLHLSATSDTATVTNRNYIEKTSGSHRKPLTVVVVGGGVGGLAVASRVASSFANDSHNSISVILLEKNSRDQVGGRCGSFWTNVPNIGKFRHERGPSLLLLKNVYQELFADCHRKMNEESTWENSSDESIMKDYGLEIRQCLPAYRVVFEDGDTIQLGFPNSGANSDYLKELEENSRKKMDQYEDNGSKKWDGYMRACSAFLSCGLPNFIEEKIDLTSFPAFIAESLRDGLKSWPLKAHSDVLDSTFESNKMKTLSSFQDLYVGLEPYRNNNEFGGGVMRKTAPAVFGLLAALELHPTNELAGVFAPIGGFSAVSNAFEKLCVACGVDIRYDSIVTSVDESGVCYEAKDGEERFLSSDCVIVNADLPYATKTLVNMKKDSTSPNLVPPPRYDWNDKFDYSSGVIAFHWSVDIECKELDTHNVFLIANSRSDSERSWSTLRNGQETERFPFNFYVHRACATDKSAAPDGCDSILVLVPCGTLTRDTELAEGGREHSIKEYKKQFDAGFQSRIKEKVLKRLSVLSGLEDLGSHIVHENVDTPGQYADNYNLAAGTPFALSHGFGQLSVTRPSQQSRDVENVFFVGASTRPGNGVPLVLLGAKQVADKVVRKIQSRKKRNLLEDVG